MALKDLIYTSDYPLDYVVYRLRRSFESNTIHQIFTIQHRLGYAPLLIGRWSLNADFSDSHSFSFARIDGGGTVYASSNTTSVSVALFAHTSAGFKAYVEILGYAPPGVAENVVPLNFEKHRFDSDYPYKKLLLEGKIDEVNGEVVVNHNLGYIPQCRVWGTFSDSFLGDVVCQAWTIDTNRAIASPTPTRIDVGVRLTSQHLIFRNNGYPNAIKPPFFYHIYGDQI